MRTVGALVFGVLLSFGVWGEAVARPRMEAVGVYEASLGDSTPPSRFDSVLFFRGDKYVGRVEVTVSAAPGLTLEAEDLRVVLYNRDHSPEAVLYPPNRRAPCG